MNINRIIAFFLITRLEKELPINNYEGFEIFVNTNVTWPSRDHDHLVACIECEENFSAGDNVTVVSIRAKGEAGTLSLALHDHHRMRTLDNTYAQISTC